jgi:hypothetical protein
LFGSSPNPWADPESRRDLLVNSNRETLCPMAKTTVGAADGDELLDLAVSCLLLVGLRLT